MKLKVGDKVKFLNDSGEGIVTKIVDEKLVNVQIEDGFDIPVLITELIKAGGTYEDDIHVPDLIPEYELQKDIKEQLNAKQSDDKLSFILVPDNEDLNCDLYLVNASPYHILYNILAYQKGSYTNMEASSANAGDIIFLDTKSYEELTPITKFVFQMIFFKDDDNHLLEPYRMELPINWVRFKIGIYYTECDYFEGKPAVFEIIDLQDREKEFQVGKELKGLLSDKIKTDIKEKSFEPERKNTKTKDGIEEVDLHIEQLVDDHRGLSNREILEIQMGRFITALEGGILHKVKKMVFIHGIGNGKLKHQIRKELDMSYKNLKYQDASFKEYGFGATLVILK